jgi:tRNA threonylcarbamoyl adenosine modification protein YeaZ
MNRLLVISTSSADASIALITAGELMFAAARSADRRAGEVVLALLAEMTASTGVRLPDVEGYVADQGPGSFTGTRVGVMLVKTWGFLYERPCGVVSAFDLVDHRRTVALPNRKSDYLLRVFGQLPHVTDTLPVDVVRDDDGELPKPRAFRALSLVHNIVWTSAVALLPDYVLPPSISVPKRPQEVLPT